MFRCSLIYLMCKKLFLCRLAEMIWLGADRETTITSVLFKYCNIFRFDSQQQISTKLSHTADKQQITSNNILLSEQKAVQVRASERASKLGRSKSVQFAVVCRPNRCRQSCSAEVNTANCQLSRLHYRSTINSNWVTTTRLWKYITTEPD